MYFLVFYYFITVWKGGFGGTWSGLRQPTYWNHPERTLRSHDLSFIDRTNCYYWWANDHEDAPLGRLLHDIHHLFKL